VNTTITAGTCSVYVANLNLQVHDDPFEAVLKGIPERARLLPNRKEPQSNYMGLAGLPPHGRYARAWRKVMRATTKLDLESGPPAKVCRVLSCTGFCLEVCLLHRAWVGRAGRRMESMPGCGERSCTPL
jgi:hypothetical protein